MPFVFQKVLNYGTQNHIITRLSLQICEILQQCNIESDDHETIQNIYIDRLMPQLIRCWEIEE